MYQNFYLVKFADYYVGIVLFEVMESNGGEKFKVKSKYNNVNIYTVCINWCNLTSFPGNITNIYIVVDLNDIKMQVLLLAYHTLNILSIFFKPKELLPN